MLEDLHCHVEGLVLDRAQLALRDPGRSRDRASRHAGGHPALVVLKLHLESTDFNGWISGDFRCHRCVTPSAALYPTHVGIFQLYPDPEIL